jgi:hypothetical protein
MSQRWMIAGSSLVCIPFRLRICRFGICFFLLCRLMAQAADNEFCFHNDPFIEILPTKISSKIGSDFAVVEPGIVQRGSYTAPPHSQLGSSPQVNQNITLEGGVVFFLHIPKTGGTTIRLNLESYDRIHYIFAKNYSIYSETVSLVEDAIVHGTPNGTILFYEVHATTAPSLFQLRHRLRRWKDVAQRNGVPTFFFTILRESIAYAFSHFNFFHLQRRNPTFERCNATQENFVRLTLYNPQCQFLFQGESSMRAQKVQHSKILNAEDCHAVQEQLINVMDWIGTTEHLTNETLPMLSTLLDLPLNHTWVNQKVSKETQDVYFGKDNVTKGVLQWILDDVSSLDVELYRMARNRYHHEILTC